MAGPWEKFQLVDQGPWSSFADVEQAPQAEAPPKPKKEGIGAAFGKGIESLLSSARTSVESFTGSPEDAARAALKREEESKYADQVSLDKVKQAYERGLLPAVGEVARQVPLALAEQAPNIGATLGGARLGAMAGAGIGSIVPGVGTAIGGGIGGILGAVAPSLLQQFGGNVQRQAQAQTERGEPLDISRTAALGAAIPQAGLDVAASLIPLGRSFAGKILGPKVEELLMRGSAQGAERLARETLPTVIGKGAAISIAAEVPTEVAQSMFERYQAGLALTTPDALEEYANVAYQATLLAPIGAVGRVSDRSTARGQVLLPGQKPGEDDNEFANRLGREIDFDRKAEAAFIQQQEEAEQEAKRVEQQEIISQGVLTPEALKMWGFGKGSISEALVGKDLSNPEELSFVKDVLSNYQKKASPKVKERIEDVFVNIDAVFPPVPAAKGEAYAGESVAPPTGESVSVAVEPSAGAPATGVAEVEPTGVVPTVADVEQPAGGEGAKPAPVIEPVVPTAVSAASPEVIAPTAPTVVTAPSAAIAPTPEVTAPTAIVETPIAPVEAPVVSVPETERDAVKQHAVKGMPIIEAPVDQLTISRDVPQFKSEADEKGIVKKLEGKFERIGVAPIQLWRRNTGDLEVISGRHRFDLAQRSGETTIPAQIHDEAAGFDATRAAILDAELNIRDEQGEVKDYVVYFEKSGITEPEAKSRGLLGRPVGQRGWTIASQGSPELIAAHRAGIVPDDAAAGIASIAPSDTRLQAVGLRAVQDNKSTPAVLNTMQAVKALATERGAPQEEAGDLFGFDDSAIKEAEEMGRIATEKQREVSKRLDAISGAAKRPEVAKAEGIDIKDEAALNKRIQELRQARAAWSNWSSNPDLVREIREEMTKPKASLAEKTPEELQRREQVAQEINQKIDQFGKVLTRIMGRFGLKDVALNLMNNMQAEGEYAQSVIRLALDAVNPVQALRHESIHALKELGFFSPQQWEVLEKQAKSKWIDQYLKNVNINKEPISEGEKSRYDAYMDLYKGDMDAIIEESIADAFADFDANKAPPGLMQALLRRMKLLFSSIKEAFGGEVTAEQVFRKAERGELKAKAAPAEAVAKPSLRAPEKRGSWYVDATPQQQETLDRWEDERTSGTPSNWQDLDIRPAREDIYDSASGFFYDYEKAKGLFEIPIADIGPLTGYDNAKDKARIQNLAEQIKENREIEPVFVAVDPNGEAYLMEGQHRSRALELLGYKSVPARVIVSMDHEEQPAAKPSLRALQTEAFKKWFGNSKVVNENGDPLVVYHGSDVEFDVFDTEEGAFFFGGKNAESFARTYGDIVTPAYLSIKKPFKGDYDDLAGADFDVLAKNGYDGAVFVDKESGLQQWVAFKPTQIKSATDNIGTFDAKKPNIRYSLRGEAPLSTRTIMESNDAFARAELGLNVAPVRGIANKVRDIAIALNNKTKSEEGAMDRQALSMENEKAIAKAIADEVAYQLTAGKRATGTGLGWYSTNYPNAVKRLGKKYPELQTNPHARSVFSALVAVTSNGEKVTKNISNATELYSKLRAGKPLVAMGNRRATALENNLQVIQDLLAKHGTDFEKVLRQEITVKDMNAQLRAMGLESDGSYLANTRVPAAAVYFGPKLGAFYANLSGSEGYLTMDLWWTRSVNRMRGLLMPKATDASIDKMREMIGDPSMSRADVVAATVPLRNKYEEYGFTTELEHLVGKKEPQKKAGRPAWNAKAEEVAGAAYDQLLFDHNIEKMANTIYKNEFEGIEEAPFTATDRAFMYRAGRRAQALLRQEGIDLTLADVQAALWYYEKRLYEKLSGKKADDIGYEEAIIAQANQAGRRAGPSVVFPERDGGGDVATGEVAGATEVRGEPSEAEPARLAKASLRAPQTEAFKRWFGDSKIVNEDGTPKVMYHGTARDITEFRPKQAGAIFVTDNPDFAEMFADTSNDWIARHYKDFLSADQIKAAKNNVPRILKEMGYRGDEAASYKKQIEMDNPSGGALDVWTTALKEQLPTGPNVMPLYVRAEKPFDYENPEHIEQLNKYEQDNRYTEKSISNFVGSVKTGSWETIESRKVQDAIKSLGFDGFYVKEGGVKNLAVYKPEQLKSATGNIGTFDIAKPDIRYSLRAKPFNPDSLPKTNRPYTLPQNTVLYHGAYRSIADAIQASGYLMSRPGTKSSGGTPYENGLIWFGNQEVAQQFADSKADPFKVQSDEEAGIVREPGRVFEALTDKPYRLISYSHKFSAEEAKKVNEALGLPDYKQVRKGDSANIAAMRAHDYRNSKAPRYVVKSAKFDQEISAPWPLIAEALNADGIYFDNTVALTAQNGIRLGEPGKPMERFSLRSTIPQATRARIEQTTVAREEKGFIERMQDAISPSSYKDLRAQLLNRYNRLGVYDKLRAKKMGGVALLADQAAESAALLSDLAAGVVASSLGVHDRKGGVPVFRNGITTVSNKNGTIKSPVVFLAPLARAPGDYQAYQYWAGVKRGSRFMADGKEQLFKPDDVQKAEALRQQYLKEGINFEEIQKEWIKYNDGIVEYMVDTGVLSKERADLYREHSDYIPFYRQINGEETVGPRVFQAISGVKPPRKLKGSEAPLDDFLENVVRNTQSAIQAGMKNVAAQRAAKVAVDIQMATRLNYKSSLPTSFDVLENGKVVSYASQDMLFINAIKSLGLPDLPFIGLFAGPANLLRNLVTKDPGFMLANLMRDSMSAWVTSGVKMKPMVDTISNFGSALVGKSPEFEALMNAGILGGYEFSQNVEQSGREFGKFIKKQAKVKTPGMKGVLEMGAKPFTSLWDALEKGTTASDAATRMEVYKRTLEDTKSAQYPNGNEAEALFKSLEVMNFNRKGSSAVVRILTAAVPFLNARMQGLDLLYRSASGGMVAADAQRIQKNFFVRGATIAALSAAYWAMTHDDDEYKKQEQETRDNYWLIPSLGVKIPIPFEIGVLFKVIPERILGYTMGSDTGEDFLKSMKRQLVSTLAFNPIPQAVLPILETTTNFSLFTMRPIVGQGLEGLQPAYQVGPGTSRLAEGLGAMTKGMAAELQVSPMKIDQLINGYTGTMGMYMVNLMDAVYDMTSDSPKPSRRFEQMPLIRRFAVDPEARGNVTAYYELKNSVDAVVRTSNMLERTMDYEELPSYLTDNMGMLATKDYLLDMEKTMKEFREMKIMIRSAKMGADEKRDAIKSIDQLENQLTSNIAYLKGFAKSQ